MFLFLASASAQDLFVDKDGVGGGTCSDSFTKAQNDLTHPWCTLNHAEEMTAPGDIVYIREGTYNDPSGDWCTYYDCGTLHITNSGTAGNPITFKGYPGDVIPIINGVNAGAPEGETQAPIRINSGNYIVLEDLEVAAGYRGIRISSGDHITIRRVHVHDTVGPTNNNNGGVVTFQNGADDVKNLLVEDCVFHDNWDESGPGCLNCSGIHIYGCGDCVFRNNEIYNQYAGIRMKGDIHHYTAENPSIKGVQIYGNTIHDILFYGIETGTAGFQEDMNIFNNTIYNIALGTSHTGIGLAGVVLGSASTNNPGRPHDVRYYNNTVDCSGKAGIGGYVQRHGTLRYSVYNNIFYNCGQSSEYLEAIGFKEETRPSLEIYENYNFIYQPNITDFYHWGDGTGSNAFDMTWQQWRTHWSGVSPPEHSENGLNDSFGDPLFVNAANHNYYLQSGSPACTAGENGTYTGAFACASGPDTTPPVRSNGSPTGTLVAGTTNAILSLTTNENATCRYSAAPNIVYASMTNTFTTTGSTNHSRSLTGLTNGSTYNYFVRCQDSAGNPNTTDYAISFSIAMPSSDTTAPAAVTNLSVTSCTTNTCSLTWTAPGDDGSSGTASQYDIRYSTSTITSSNWASASQTTGEPTPLVAGTTQTFTLTGLNSNTTYYFGLRTSDEVPNVSGLSNVISSTTQPSSCTPGITVDSTYSGYSTSRIDDGTINAYGGTTTTWASQESSTQPHWIEINYCIPTTINKLEVWWAFNDYQQNFMTSQQIQLQYWNGSSFVTAATMTNSTAQEKSTLNFTSVTASRFRLYQPTNMGYSGYARVIWLTEIELSQATVTECTVGQTQSCVSDVEENCLGTQSCVNSFWGTCVDTPNDNCPVTLTCVDGEEISESCYCGESIFSDGFCCAASWQETECIEECEEDWFCGEWSSCLNGSQFRDCTDLSECGEADYNESQSCGECTNGATQGCTISNCPGTQTCSNNTWGSCIDIANDGCPSTGTPNGPVTTKKDFNVSTEPTTLKPNQNFTLTVTEKNNPLQNTKIKYADKTYYTNTKGQATLKTQKDYDKLTLSKTGYNSQVISLNIVLSECGNGVCETGETEISCSQDCKISLGELFVSTKVSAETLTITITGSQGKPVADVEVKYGDETKRTNSLGITAFTELSESTIIVVSKLGYQTKTITYSPSLTCEENTKRDCTTTEDCLGEQTCKNGKWSSCSDVPEDGCPVGQSDNTITVILVAILIIGIIITVATKVNQG